MIRSYLIVLLLLAACSARASGAVLLIRSGPCEYEETFRLMGIPYRASDSLKALETLKPGGVWAVIVCSLQYPRPNTLTPAQQKGLEGFVRAGGRAYVEFSRGQSSPLFGVKPSAEPQRDFFRRLFVRSLHPATRTLGADALLEEHNSAFLPYAPPAGAKRLLDYGKALGTYRLYRREPGVRIVLDLQKTHAIRRIAQRYGAQEPNYRPEKVVIATSADGKTWRPLTTSAGSPLLPGVDISFPPRPARYVRFQAIKFRRSPVADFLFIGETEVFDSAGRNLALHKPYTLSPTPSLPDSGHFLTDGHPEGRWSERLAPGWGTQAPPEEDRSPGLAEIPFGKGTVLLALTKLSDFRSRRYRLTARWEELLRQAALYTLPSSIRRQAQRHYIPLSAHTEPRRWQEPGQPVRLVVRTAPGVHVAVRCANLRLPPARPGRNGRYEWAFTPPAGNHRLHIEAASAVSRRKAAVLLEVSPRREKYRQALDQNIRWFMRSGVLPARDGSGGVYAQRCMAWLDGGPWDGGPHDALPSPYRVDCNAASAVALWLYGDVSEQTQYHAVSRRIADTMLPSQFADPSKASFGGWKWLYEKSDTLYFWDDNTRVTVALLWLYGRTGDRRYLEAGLKTTELCRAVAQEDGVIARHAIEPVELDALGRAAYRQFRQGMFVDFDLIRWAWAAGVSGDPLYRELALTCARTRGHQAIQRGLPFALFLNPDPKLRETLLQSWQAYLKNPDVRRYGVPRTGGHDFQYAFINDCSIGTLPGEPLTDQLYTVPHLLLQAWWAYKATGDWRCLEAFHRIGDYLARIQSQDSDPRLQGAWMRGFDLEAWEEYGAPYDPFYGPYSAYTGWMNAFASTALALYLLNESPFPPEKGNPEARAVLDSLRRQPPPDRTQQKNIALHRPYTLEPAPQGAYPDSGGELTDGVIDGPYEDGLSTGYPIPVEGQSIAVTTTLDLGEIKTIGMAAQRYGATRSGYNPDRVELYASEDGIRYRKIAEIPLGESAVGSLWLPLKEPAQTRFLRFRAFKTRRAGSDFLFIGETIAYETAAAK
ncbi:MAG: discoidin domain-containing protein [Armatimonadetes bacterium]|nr:discoidin domain-containing protein [Armatimonadota bacterium]